MTGKEAFRIWAPAGAKWTDWARPVPFLAAGEDFGDYCDPDFSVAAAAYIDENDKGTALIVDLPGAESVREGLALAKAGYRPVPIFNGTMGQKGARAVTDNWLPGAALLLAAAELAKIKLGEDAPPAFLTDSSRRNRFRMEPSMYDNSWDVYPQDLPSAEYLLGNGIQKVIVIGDSVFPDLKKILYGFQKKGLEIFRAERYESPKRVKLWRPLLGAKE